MQNTITEIIEAVADGKISAKKAKEQIRDIITIDHSDVDDWVGIKYGAWYHPSIELTNYTNENRTKTSSLLLSDLVANCLKDYMNLRFADRMDEMDKIIEEWSKK
jgi:hypothetical protein